MSEMEMEIASGLTLEQELAFNGLSSTEKAAIVMFLLEENGASAVMKTLSPTQVTAVSRAMIKVSDVDQPIVVAVVDVVVVGEVVAVVVAVVVGVVGT